MFDLTFLDKAVYVDADMVLLQNIDDLFDRDTFAAAPDIGSDAVTNHFNSGLFVCTPDRKTFDSMRRAIGSIKSFDGGDQGFLNEYFPNADALDQSYNCLKRVFTELPMYYERDEAKVLHFVGVKPWHSFNETTTKFRRLEALWFEMLPDEFKLELFFATRSAPLAAETVMRRQYGDDFVEALELIRLRSAADRLTRNKRPLDVSDELFYAGDLENSILVSRAALSRNNTSSEHMFRVARSCHALEKFEMARDYIRMAISVSPGKEKYVALQKQLDDQVEFGVALRS